MKLATATFAETSENLHSPLSLSSEIWSKAFNTSRGSESTRITQTKWWKSKRQQNPLARTSLTLILVTWRIWWAP